MDEGSRERHEALKLAVEGKFDEVHERLDAIQEFERTCPVYTVDKEVATLKKEMADLPKSSEVKELKKYLDDYPPLLWLFRHKTRLVLMWAAFGVSMWTLFIAPWFDRRLIGALLEFAGVPDGFVQVIAGK